MTSSASRLGCVTHLLYQHKGERASDCAGRQVGEAGCPAILPCLALSLRRLPSDQREQRPCSALTASFIRPCVAGSLARRGITPAGSHLLALPNRGQEARHQSENLLSYKGEV